jgi:hypothetical protein
MPGKYQVFHARDGFRWRMLDGRSVVVARADRGYARREDCLEALGCWWKGCPLLIEDQSMDRPAGMGLGSKIGPRA